MWIWSRCIKQSSSSGEFWIWICLLIFAAAKLYVATAYLSTHFFSTIYDLFKVCFTRSSPVGGSVIFYMEHTTFFLIGSLYFCVFELAHVWVLEKSFPAIIQKISMFKYIAYETDRETLLFLFPKLEGKFVLLSVRFDFVIRGWSKFTEPF